MRWWLKIPLFAVGGIVVSACALPYYTQAVGGQIGLLRQRVPIEDIVVDPTVDAMTRDRLQLVTSLRRFAVEQLALPDNASYTSYVDLERDYVVWNVVAAQEFSIEPVTWCFPIAGCVAYRGYFDRDKAVAFEHKLRQKGYDTYSGGSAAYSTLVYFDDPVLNTMLLRGDVEVAATLFHELAHQRIYVKSDTELSESLATAVEQYAVEAWLKSNNRLDDLTAFRSRLERRREFALLVAEQRARLTRIFASNLGPADLREAKAAAYDRMRLDYENLKQSWGGSGDYDRWFGSDLNNAKLVAVTSYERWVPGLRRRIDMLGPEAFFSEMESLVGLDEESRMARLESWNVASVMTSLADHR